LFRDRHDAGECLAARLEHLRGARPVVLGIPRGGLLVAAVVAGALDAPLDVIVVRKLGVPGAPELGMGAVGEGGVRVVSGAFVHAAGVGPAEIAAVAVREQAEVERRARRYRGARPMAAIAGRVVVVVDDGVATGGTAEAAVRIARAHAAARIVLAVPVAPPDGTHRLAALVDELVVLEQPTPFLGVGRWYVDFPQASDDEVVRALAGVTPP
jgi:putative phosphoribosyl transferase